MTLAPAVSVELVARYLNPENELLCGDAAEALSLARHPEALEALLAFLRQRIPMTVRRSALLTLAASPLPEAGEYLLTVIAKEPHRSCRGRYHRLGRQPLPRGTTRARGGDGEEPGRQRVGLGVRGSLCITLDRLLPPGAHVSVQRVSVDIYDGGSILQGGIISILLLVHLACTTPPLLACSCVAPDEGACGLAKPAQAIFTGRVVAEKKAEWITTYTFSVTEGWQTIHRGRLGHFCVRVRAI